MTDDRPTEPGREILGRLHPGAQFTRVPSWVGGGEVLIASVDDGCVAIAPPATALSPSDTPESLTEWRVGWFPADEQGVDLDVGPDTASSVHLRELLPLEQFTQVRLFLFRNHVADIRHSALVRGRLGGDAVKRADTRIRVMEAQWRDLFPDEPWPLHAGAQTAAHKSLADVLAASGQRLIATFFPQKPGFAGVLGQGSVCEFDEAPTAQNVTFGPGLMLVAGAEAHDVQLVVDFDALLRVHPEIWARPVTVHVIAAPDECVATVSLEPQTGHVSLSIHLDHHLDLEELRLALGRSTEN